MRFGLAAVLIALPTRRQVPLPVRLRRRGTVLGLLLGAGFLLQAQGLLTTDATTSGLLTGLLVVVAPVLERLFFGRRHGRRVWSAVALAALGLARQQTVAVAVLALAVAAWVGAWSSSS